MSTTLSDRSVGAASPHRSFQPTAAAHYGCCCRAAATLCWEPWGSENQHRPLHAQYQARNNIEHFLDGCARVWEWDRDSLFETDELFLGTKFERVIQIISRLSHTPEAKRVRGVR